MNVTSRVLLVLLCSTCKGYETFSHLSMRILNYQKFSSIKEAVVFAKWMGYRDVWIWIYLEQQFRRMHNFHGKQNWVIQCCMLFVMIKTPSRYKHFEGTCCLCLQPRSEDGGTMFLQYIGNGVCWLNESASCMRLCKPNARSKQHFSYAGVFLGNTADW